MSDQNQSSDESVADDLLKGAVAIGAFLGAKPDEVYYLARTGKYPIGKLGKLLIASKKQLLRAHHTMTRAA